MQPNTRMMKTIGCYNCFGENTGEMIKIRLINMISTSKSWVNKDHKQSNVKLIGCRIMNCT